MQEKCGVRMQRDYGWLQNCRGRGWLVFINTFLLSLLRFYLGLFALLIHSCRDNRCLVSLKHLCRDDCFLISSIHQCRYPVPRWLMYHLASWYLRAGMTDVSSCALIPPCQDDWCFILPLDTTVPRWPLNANFWSIWNTREFMHWGMSKIYKKSGECSRRKHSAQISSVSWTIRFARQAQMIDNISLHLLDDRSRYGSAGSLESARRGNAAYLSLLSPLSLCPHYVPSSSTVYQRAKFRHDWETVKLEVNQNRSDKLG